MANTSESPLQRASRRPRMFEEEHRNIEIIGRYSIAIGARALPAGLFEEEQLFIALDDGEEMAHAYDHESPWLRWSPIQPWMRGEST